MPHSKPELESFTRPLGSRVVIRERDDLDPSSDTFQGKDGKQHSITAGVGRTILTALPDHVGVCEVVEVGPDVTNVRKGDVCMIDFHDVEQPFTVDREDLYLCPSEAFCCRLEGEDLVPLPDFVLTKSSPQRFSLSYYGSESYRLTPAQVSQGYAGKKIWSHKQKKEVPCFFLTHEEVVAVGSNVRGIEVGDLVVICTDFSLRIRLRGEVDEEGRALFHRITSTKSHQTSKGDGFSGEGVLAVIDDRAIYDAYLRRKASAA